MTSASPSPAPALLTVCGIDELPAQRGRRVTHVLSLVDPGWPEIAALAGLGAGRRRMFRFHDIIEPRAGQTAPDASHLAAILRFGAELAAWPAEAAPAHLLVHCHMGVSRSTAAMLALLAQARPEAGEDALFARLRAIRPRAWPNSAMVGHADALLGRGGRLLAALRRHYRHQAGRDPELAEWMARLGRHRELAMAAA